MVTIVSTIDYMNEASVSPILDPRTYAILQKGYATDDTRYDIYQDLDIITEVIYGNTYYRNKLIYGITLVPNNSGIASFKNKGSRSPNISGLEQQAWLQALNESDKDYAIFLLEEDELYPQAEPMLCFSRLIREAGSDRELGVIRIDVLVRDIEKMIEGAKLEDNAIAILTDYMGRSITTSKEQQPASYGSYISLHSQNDEYGIQLSSYIPMTYFYKSAQKPVIFILLFALLSCVISAVLAELLSDRTMKPIRNLNTCMKEVQKGDLTVRSKVTDGGEMGEVCESFNVMVENTEQLIDRIYVEEEQKRVAEFQALQAQISPHFLLNTLNTIKWMAHLQGNKSIEATLGNLSKILSFAVRESNDKITISTELEQLRYYIEILQVRYPNRFVVNFNVDEDIQNCLTLKYLLQPFLENSVFHGLDGLDHDGVLDISITRENGCITYVLEDNGCGMTQEQINQVLRVDGYMPQRGINQIGVFNVVQRIELEYGSPYCVKIDSELGSFTRTTITIPEEYAKTTQEESV